MPAQAMPPSRPKAAAAAAPAASLSDDWKPKAQHAAAVAAAAAGRSAAPKSAWGVLRLNRLDETAAHVRNGNTVNMNSTSWAISAAEVSPSPSLSASAQADAAKVAVGRASSEAQPSAQVSTAAATEAPAISAAAEQAAQTNGVHDDPFPPAGEASSNESPTGRPPIVQASVDASPTLDSPDPDDSSRDGKSEVEQPKEEIAAPAPIMVAPELREKDLDGTWLLDCYEHSDSYEIRCTEDSRSADHCLNEAAREKSPLLFMQRLPCGKEVRGHLENLDDSYWHWEVSASDGRRMRLRREDEALPDFKLNPRLISSCLLPGASEWQAPKTAQRPTAYAFFNTYNDARGYRYAHTLGVTNGVFPLIGLTAGWLPCTVLGGDTSVGKMRVRFDRGFWDPFEAYVASGGRPTQARRVLPRPDPGWYDAPQKGGKKGIGKGMRSSFGRGQTLASLTYPGKGKHRPGAVMMTVPVEGQAFFKQGMRPMRGGGYQRSIEQSIPMSLIRTDRRPPPRPLLSILCTRWFDYWTDIKHSDYCILNDGYMADLFMGPGSVNTELSERYEVYTIFVRQSRDLQRLDAQYLRSLLKGLNIVAWYLVWPSANDNALAGTEFSSGGFVSEKEFFSFLQATERLGIRTGWPHEAHLYRQLCGKLWIPQMCLDERYRVPPTTRVHYAEFRRNGEKAALRALDVLMGLRKAIWGKESVSFDKFRGVVKLGFSWGGLDVLPFQGVKSLMYNLTRLFESKSCENNVCLVQEMVPDVVAEHRVVCFWDKRNCRHVKEPVWMISTKPPGKWDVNEFKLASSTVCQRGTEARHFFGGDRYLQVEAEKQADRLVDLWLLWYRTESPNPPQVTRIDFLVSWAGAGANQIHVWTCEVGECGASLCSIEVDGRNLASLNTAVQQDPSGRLPLALPDKMQRNSGWKG
eukprot:gnl/TRDRNA2_/TRDRNA2_81505_c0_seq1.p1 gnl/TRDRNA2_/TRDRNA2_81505_c0~~gnl/TRDRNA2_/TRDRNA2_81505_c0_seq1.p1  ORF type:complete len:929 (+),score=143.69 gnl/TRDRNA2_/TRDRNA2_81505_c0_seq1:33-2789(+)